MVEASGPLPPPPPPPHIPPTSTPGIQPRSISKRREKDDATVASSTWSSDDDILAEKRRLAARSNHTRAAKKKAASNNEEKELEGGENDGGVARIATNTSGDNDNDILTEKVKLAERSDNRRTARKPKGENQEIVASGAVLAEKIKLAERNGNRRIRKKSKNENQEITASTSSSSSSFVLLEKIAMGIRRHGGRVLQKEGVDVEAPQLTRGQRLTEPLPTPGAVRVRGTGPRTTSVVSFPSSHHNGEEPRNPSVLLTDATLVENQISVAVPSRKRGATSAAASRRSSSRDLGNRKVKVRGTAVVVFLLVALVTVVATVVFIMGWQSQNTIDELDQSSSPSSYETNVPGPTPSPNASVPPSLIFNDESPVLNMSVGEFLRDSGPFNLIAAFMVETGTVKFFNLSNTITLVIPTDSNVNSNPFDFKFISPQWRGHTHRWSMHNIFWGKAWRVEELMEAKQVRSVAGIWVRFNNGTVQGTPILQPNYARCLNGIIHSTDGFAMPDWLITKRTIRNELQDHFEYWYHILERLDMLDEMLSSGESQPKTLFIPSPESMEMIPNDILNDDTIMEGIVHYNYLPDLNFVVQTSFNEMEVEREDNTLLLPTAWPGQVIRATPGLLEPLFLINRTMVLNDGLELADVDVLCIDGVIQVVDGLLLPPSLSNVTVGE